ACRTVTPFRMPTSAFVHAGGARSGDGSDASASRRLSFLPTWGACPLGDRGASSRDPLPRRVDRVEPREQDIAETLLELAREVGAQASGPQASQRTRMRAQKTREHANG